MTHRNVNNLLTVIVIILAIFLLIAPFLGQLDWVVNGPGKTPVPQFVSEYKKAGSSAISTSSAEPANYLYIPSIGASSEVLQGESVSTVDKGLWHRPLTVAPGSSGNSVIVGHRFSYNPSLQQPLYQLDKIKIGDIIYARWNGSLTEFTVTEKKVVKASEVSVESPTTDTRLTLYTCTPLWNPINRLVVVAKPTGATQ